MAAVRLDLGEQQENHGWKIITHVAKDLSNDSDKVPLNRHALMGHRTSTGLGKYVLQPCFNRAVHYTWHICAEKLKKRRVRRLAFQSLPTL
jgi:hypothetical protein